MARDCSPVGDVEGPAGEILFAVCRCGVRCRWDFLRGKRGDCARLTSAGVPLGVAVALAGVCRRVVRRD